MVIRINAETLRTMLDDNPRDAMLFYRHLARSLGRRLIRSYESHGALEQASVAATHGTGQVHVMGEAH